MIKPLSSGSLKKSTILLIGSGKLAQHLAHWFNINNDTNASLISWDRHQDPHLIRSHISKVTHVWLAISDSAITPFYEKFLLGHDLIAVHFSGALNDDRIISAHPLMSFTDQLYNEEIYSKIHFGLTGGANLSTALPGFNNSFFTLKKEFKPLYHALCVVAGNFPQMLWDEVLTLATRESIPTEAFNLYIKQISENFIAQKEKSITGPFVRNDLSTIEKNIKSLEKTKLQEIYKIFQKEFLK